MSGSIHFAPGSLIVAARRKTNEDAFARRPRQQRFLSAKQALMKKQSETLQVESYISPAEKAEGPGILQFDIAELMLDRIMPSKINICILRPGISGFGALEKKRSGRVLLSEVVSPRCEKVPGGSPGSNSAPVYRTPQASVSWLLHDPWLFLNNGRLAVSTGSARLILFMWDDHLSGIAPVQPIWALKACLAQWGPQPSGLLEK
ncbi:uncharacterized protein CIMG_11040 [Coccidioides immitis RS]|uniref:Uncharacterized protein n=1 Tax=Coccidioides immitis (strain RS) TaxID=246410 RepID=A0A0D8JWC0_COCIM|nr:uncharacterized protein CIMG_11040 [Coccidioides immitis RS]KJF61434.1 hypothetical protein CIMG_11040 [Coccidioides immitis RS]